MHLSRSIIALGLWVVAMTCGAADANVIPAPGIGNVNNDAMTVKACRQRLALPKAARPKDDDPRIDLDAVCANMLDLPSTKARRKPAAPRPASASSGAH